MSSIPRAPGSHLSPSSISSPRMPATAFSQDSSHTPAANSARQVSSTSVMPLISRKWAGAAAADTCLQLQVKRTVLQLKTTSSTQRKDRRPHPPRSRQHNFTHQVRSQISLQHSCTELKYCNKEDISSDAEKSTQLLLKSTGPLQTQGGRMGKQECRPTALQALEHAARTLESTLAHGQL